MIVVRWSFACIAAALLLILLVTVGRSQPGTPARAPAAPPRGETSGDPLGQAWSRPMADVVGLCVSPDGARTVAVDSRGMVRCFDGRGRTAWEQRLEGVDSLENSRRGTLTLAYARRQPLSRHVYFINEEGRVVHVLETDAGVQAAAVSADGRLGVVAAGRRIHFCRRSGETMETRILSAPGEVRQVHFGPGGNLYVASQNPDAVSLIRPNGSAVWRRESSGVPSISASEDGRWLAVGTQAAADSCVITLLDHRNQPVWTTDRGGRAPRVRVSGDGSAVYLTYEHRVEHGQDRRHERRLAYFADGRLGWIKGGAYTTPLYVGASPSGEWVVALDNEAPHLGASGLPRFRLFGRGGGRLWIYTCAANVLIAAASRDGRSIAAYRTDGVLELLRVAVR